MVLSTLKRVKIIPLKKLTGQLEPYQGQSLQPFVESQ